MLAVFATTLFLGALLLFVVQPMVGKMILPALGGTPAVWNTCMVFFQAALLAGYAYAHGAVRLLGSRRQPALHIILLLLPLLVLPVAIATRDVPSSTDTPQFWLLGRLLLGVGLPFFVVSTTAPLLQHWFSRTGHASARDPYFLYGASNLGSLLALFGYPVVVERLWDLERQSALWSLGYGLLVVMIVVCAVLHWGSGGQRHAAVSAVDGVLSPGDAGIPGIVWRRRARWVFLAFVPSSLMLGVTTHVTTDLAPVPLLWVLPLALYLLTFVLVFARRPLIAHRAMVRVFPYVVVPVAIMLVQGEYDLGWLPILLHFVLFFVAAMVCHGELVADRPDAAHLTEFYLWMSVGGVLGGAFNALVAPLLFPVVVEYPLVMLAACLAVRDSQPGRTLMHRVASAVGLALVLGAGTGAFLALVHSDVWRVGASKLATVLVPAVACLVLCRRPLKLALSLAAVLIVCELLSPERADPTIYVGRNFFGVKLVTTDPAGDYHTFHHGTTVHGIQDHRRPHVPLAYYHTTGPMGDVFASYRAARTPRRVAVVGLGAGALATYARHHDRFDFYEIDPEVARIARDPEMFSFLDDCAGEVQVILGDGRIQLARVPDETYGLITIDAFSSDAIPTHLLTREALALYLSKLDERGFLAFHITNRYLDLAPLLAKLAEADQLVCFMRNDSQLSTAELSTGKYASRFLVLARRRADVRRIAGLQDWVEQPAPTHFKAWTDQFTNVLSVVKFRLNRPPDVNLADPDATSAGGRH